MPKRLSAAYPEVSSSIVDESMLQGVRAQRTRKSIPPTVKQDPAVELSVALLLSPASFQPLLEGASAVQPGHLVSS